MKYTDWKESHEGCRVGPDMLTEGLSEPGYRVVMLDFGEARVKSYGESNEEWGSEKADPDEDGAV